MPEFIITFGDQYRREPHPTFPAAHPDGFVTIEAADIARARAIAFDRFGQKWSMAYSKEEFESDESRRLYTRGELGRVKAGAVSIPSGVWRHAKGAHYLVLGVAADSNNEEPRDEPQVVYVSLEGWGLPGSRMRYRSLSEFLDRFTPLADNQDVGG